MRQCQNCKSTMDLKSRKCERTPEDVDRKIIRLQLVYYCHYCGAKYEEPDNVLEIKGNVGDDNATQQTTGEETS